LFIIIIIIIITNNETIELLTVSVWRHEKCVSDISCKVIKLLKHFFFS